MLSFCLYPNFKLLFSQLLVKKMDTSKNSFVTLSHLFWRPLRMSCLKLGDKGVFFTFVNPWKRIVVNVAYWKNWRKTKTFVHPSTSCAHLRLCQSRTWRCFLKRSSKNPHFILICLNMPLTTSSLPGLSPRTENGLCSNLNSGTVLRGLWQWNIVGNGREVGRKWEINAKEKDILIWKGNEREMW